MHPLYKIEVSLLNENQLLDTKKLNIGLRTVTVRREKDQWGESFEFNINGFSIFAMGADYIPEDNIIARCSKEKTETLIKDCWPVASWASIDYYGRWKLL
jgi:beta-mannosidase